MHLEQYEPWVQNVISLYQDSSDQTAITEFILENNNKYFLRANKAGASCYIAFETSDMDLGMPVDNPCEVDPHIDQDKALLGLNFSR